MTHFRSYISNDPQNFNRMYETRAVITVNDLAILMNRWVNIQTMKYL